jgi:hypothetical protein
MADDEDWQAAGGGMEPAPRQKKRKPPPTASEPASPDAVRIKQQGGRVGFLLGQSNKVTADAQAAAHRLGGIITELGKQTDDGESAAETKTKRRLMARLVSAEEILDTTEKRCDPPPCLSACPPPSLPTRLHRRIHTP